MSERETSMGRKGIDRIDFRLRKAQALTAALMREIEPYLPVDTRLGDVHDAMLDVLHANGAAWTTDEERAKMGLEPRDDIGWTPSERVRHEQDRIEAMQMLMSFVVQLNGDPRK